MSDYSFLLGAQPIKVPGALDYATQGLTLSQLMDSATMRNIAMQQARQEMAGRDALNAEMPDLAADKFSDAAVQRAVQRNPSVASVVYDMVEKKRKAEADIGKSVAETAEKKSIADKNNLAPFANRAYELSQRPPGTISPGDIGELMKGITANGLERLIPAIPMQQWADPEGQRAALKTIGSSLFEAEKQASAAETNRSRLVDEKARAGNYASEASRRLAQTENDAGNLKVHQGQLGVAQGNLAVRRMEADPFGMLASAAKGGPAAQQAAAGSTGDSFLQTLPQPVADQVKALAEGRMSFPGGFALKSPYWQNMISMVAKYDPNFDAVNYNARSQTRTAFSKGKEAQSLNALNTVMGHLDNFDKAADALGNTSYPIVNKLYNTVGSQVSPEIAAKVDSYGVAKQAVVSELERAYRGSGGSEADIKRWGDSVNNAQSPEAAKAAIHQMVDLLGSKIDALGDQYNKGMGTTSQGLTLLNPKAQATYNRLSGPAAPQSSNTVTLPDGKSFTFPTPEAAATFTRQLGIQ